MVLHADAGVRAFADKFLRLGNGETEAVPPPDFVSLHSFGTLTENMNTLLDTIYPEKEVKYVDHTWLMQRAILAHQNNSAGQINKLVASTTPPYIATMQ